MLVWETKSMDNKKYIELSVKIDEVGKMLGIYPEMRGFVDSRYAGALGLLRLLGFDLSEPVPFGPLRAPFCQYTIRRLG